METTYDERKFTELVVHVAARLGSDRAGGATKLNKVLFFAEFAHTRRTGKPIAGADYQKLDHGPAARRLRPVRDQLIERGDAKLVEEDFLGYRQHRLVPTREADLSAFTSDELATIDKVLEDLDGLNARQVSDLSHDEAGWRLVDYGETIPYEAAFIPARQIVTPTGEQLAREAAARYGLLST